MRVRKSLSTLMVAGTVLAASGSVFGQAFTDTEPNNTKAAAQATVFTTAGDGVLGTITGSSTSTSTTVTGLGSADYYRVKTPAASPGIYRYQFAITATGTAGHTGTLRGLSQSAGVIGTTDSQAQGSVTTTAVPRSSVFYAFGTEGEIYYRVTGASTTTGTYTAELTRTTVTPTVVSTPFKAGNITISTILQTTVDTEFMVYDSTFTPVATFKNDDESIAGGGTGATLQSIATRSLGAGTYYIAISNNNTNNSEAAATDDDTLASIVADFPGVVFNSSTTTNVDLDLFITDGCNVVAVPQTKVNAFDVNWVQFTVASPDVPCLALSESADPATIGAPTQFFATVTPASAGNTAITSVVADLRNFGGGAAVAMSNDGLTNGDVAVDNIWTAQLNISINPPFQVPWTATVTDADARSTTNFGLLSVSLSVPPNDTCAGAATLGSLPARFVYGINQATIDADIGCNSGTAGANNGIWFTYTPSTTCFLAVTEDGTGTGAQDVSIAIYDGTGGCGALGTEIFCSDPETAVGTSLSAGTTYYVLVSKFSSTASSNAADFFSLLFDCQPLPAPANDTCATASVISTLPFAPGAVSNGGATHDIDVSCNATTSTGTTETRNGIWFTYTPASDCFADMSETTAQDVIISAFTGGCGGLTEVFCTGTEANVGFLMTGGTQYHILVGRASNTVSAGANDQIAFAFNACNAPPAPPANDVCSSATVVSTFPYSDTLVIAGATSDTAPSCAANGTARNGIWYTYTPSSTVLAIFNETGSEDTNIAVYSGGCAGLSEVACFATETSTTNTLTLNSGTQYHILVAHATSAASASSSYTFTMNTFPPPVNDDCTGALVVGSLPYSDTQNVYASTDELIDVACNSSTSTVARNGIWYTYTPSSDCRIALGETGSSDVTLSAFTGSCGGLTHIFCADSETTSVGFNAVSGTQYFFLVSLWSGTTTVTTTSSYTFTLDCTAGQPAPPANDNCGTATAISSLPFSDAPLIGGAFDEPIDPTCTVVNATTANPIGRFGVWYAYTPGTDCFVSISETSSLDVTISGYTGTCGALTEVFCTGTEANVGFNATASTTYFFLVSLALNSTVPTASSAYGIEFNCIVIGPPPANDTCAGAEVVSSLPYSVNADVSTATDDDDVTCNIAAATVTRAGIWYTYTPASNCILNVGDSGTQDVVFALYTGPCAGLTPVACLTTDTLSTFRVIGGTQYYILVGRYPDSASPIGATYNLTFDCLTPGANDLCSGATNITSLPFSASLPVANLSVDDPDGTCSSTLLFGTPHGAWFTYTPAADCSISLAETSGIDAIWLIFTGTCGALVESTCDVDDTLNPLVSLTGGTTYYFLLGHNSTTAAANNGTWEVSIDCIGNAPNDTCATATVVSSVPYNNVAIATSLTTDVEDGSCSSATVVGTPAGMWFSFTPTASGSYILSETSSNDAIWLVYTGACGALTEVACDVDDTTSPSIFMAAGTTYHLLVGGNSATAPTNTWSISIIPAAPNDSCATALDMTSALSSAPHTYQSMQDTRTASTDGPAGACEGFGATVMTYSIWYQFLAPANGTLSYTVDFGFGGSITGNPISTMHETTGVCAIGPGGGSTSPSTTEIGCSASDPGSLSRPVIAGRYYYIMVGDAGTLTDDGAPITLDVTFVPDAPTTDNCCRGTTCNPVTAGTCTGAVAGSNSLVVTSCGTGNTTATCCYADYNHDGIQSIDDLFLYFNAYFTSSPYANFGGDAVATPTIDDLFLYINAYFGTCL